MKSNHSATSATRQFYATASNKLAHASHAEQQHQAGLTLLELIVALAISSIVLLGTTTLLTSSAESRKRVEGLQQLHQEVSFTSQLLQQQMAQIAYRGINTDEIKSRKVPIESLELEFPAVDGEWQTGQVLKATETTVTYRYSGSSIADGSSDGSIRTCVGDNVELGEIVETRLELNHGALICIVGSESETLAGSFDGAKVEEMIVEIGVDNDGDMLLDALVPVISATVDDFVNAKFIRMRLLLASADGTVRFHQKYQFNGSEFTASDYKIRKEVVIAMATRN